jgi:MarR family transcriptional regulator, organic hydroperoxide resistance regulator
MSERFIDDYLLYLLARASAGVSTQFHDRLKAHGLQVPEWRVLASLSDGDGMTIGELAALALQRQPTMTKIIDRMAEAGMVERRPDGSDRRKVRIFITGDGRRRVDGALADAKAHEREVLADYNPAEAAQMKSMLRGLLHRNGASSADD